MIPVRRGTQPPTQIRKLKKEDAFKQDPEQILQRYILWHDVERHSRKTEQDYTKTLRPFFRYLKK